MQIIVLFPLAWRQYRGQGRRVMAIGCRSLGPSSRVLVTREADACGIFIFFDKLRMDFIGSKWSIFMESLYQLCKNGKK